MATDVQILMAARDVAASVAAVKVADAEVQRLSNEQTAAARRAEELRVRAKECERRLIQLSSQKPAEPAPRVEVKTDAPPPRPSVPAPEPAFLPAVPGPVPTLSSKRQRG